MADVTPEVVRKVAHLARLKLSEQEVAMFAQQLGHILDYIEQLNGLNTDGVEPLSHVLPLKNVMRDDKVKPCLQPSDVAAMAPDRKGAFVRVPPIIETS